MPDTTRIDDQPQDMATGGAVLDARPGPRDADPDPRAQVRLGEMGLAGFPPYLMNRVIGRYYATLRAELAGLGLTTAKLRTLAVLSVIEGPLIRDLAAYTVTEQSTLSRALDGLVEDGLIRREQDPQDSRGIRVFLTAAGRERFALLWPHMARGYAAMFRGIAEDERRAFVATLQKLLANVEQAEAERPHR